MKRRKRKIRLQKKAKVILLLLFIILLGITIYLGIDYYNTTLKEIKNNYNTSVITTKKTNLFNKNHKKIGTISKEFPLNLEKVKITGLNNRYLKIKDYDYYIYYEDIKKSNEKIQIDEKDYYPLNLSIKGTNNLKLIDNKNIITINKNIKLPIEYMDKDNYYISLFNKIFTLKKDKSIKEEKLNNKDFKEAKYVSVLLYKTIADNCNDYGCTTSKVFEEEIKKLIDEGYSTINIDEYNNFINSSIRLKPKRVLLLTTEENDFTKKIEDQYKIEIELYNNKLNIKSSNKKATVNNSNLYEVKSYTPIDNFIKMLKGEEVKESAPVVKNTSRGQGVAVLNYHFFYDKSKGETCDEIICLDTKKFREQLDYLKENNYKVLTMSEFKDWMYGKLEIPEKSVLITIDDGAMGTGKHNGNHLIPILEEYKMPATLFLIAGWWSIDNYQSKYLTIQSHTYDMHQYGSCGRGQINCSTKEQAKADLQKSIDIIGNKDSFCFPFYYTSETAIQALKELDFKLAFVGGNKKATRSDNKYEIPRYVILSDITLEGFKKMVN